MYTGKMIFSQIMDFLPHYEFHKCVKRYHGNYKIKRFSCSDQFRYMAFAQLTYRESLRDIEVCLRSMQNHLYHMGIRSKISRSTLADANESRDWRIYADFASILISIARPLYQDEDLGLELDNTVYALDSTMIDLCLSLFPWAKYYKRGSIKLHTLLDLRGSIPILIKISDSTHYDGILLDELIPEPGAFYIMDRVYNDSARLNRLDQAKAFFVIRGKSNLAFQRLYSKSVDKSTGLRCDQVIRFSGVNSSRNYSQKLRRICFFDIDQNRRFIFLTNNFDLPALTIAKLYKCRWQIEIFFKWIKQHLRIKSFYGYSENAVKTQIWIAMSVYVLIAIIKKRLKIKGNLYTILQILSITLFEKTELLQALTTIKNTNQQPRFHNQLSLFNL